MTLHVRSLMWILVVLLAYCGTAQAQQVSINSVTPDPVCANSNITVSYTNTFSYFPNFPFFETADLTLYLYNAAGSPLYLAQVPANTGNGTITALIPANQLTGTYTIGITRTSNMSSTYNSPRIGLTINAQPPAPAVSNVAYCLGATGIPALTATTIGGGVPKWYTVSSGGSGTTAAPTPPTSATGTTNYYVSQIVNGCEGLLRATQQVKINPPPVKPTVVASLSYCQNTNPPSLAAAVSSGSNLKWYTSASGGTGSNVAITPSTSGTGPTTYYVSQTNFSGQTDGSGCESDRADITVTIKPVPGPPSATIPGPYCQDAVSSPLSATAVAGGTLNWFGTSNNSLGNTAPIPPTTAPGTTYYSVSQTLNGCISNVASIPVTINAKPVAPATTPVGVCQNTTPVSLATGVSSGTNLRWYTASVGGTPSTTAPSPPTSNTGSTLYYVSQTDGNGCESDRAIITFTVNGYPVAPTVSPNSLTYCQNATAAPLTATPSPNGTLNWYTVASGGTRYNNLTPSNTTSNNYYVSQSVSNCEGPRATISVTINALPPLPAVTTPIKYCQLDPAVPLSATAATNNTLYWYGTDAAGGTASTVVPTPSTATAGPFIYYLAQRDPIGCESIRAQISVTIYSKPTTPTVVNPGACLNSVPNSLALSVSATGTLKWYTASAGGTGSTVTPALSTTAVGSTTYYVSQTSGDGCESDRSAITFTVNPLPATPTVSSPALFYCQNAIAAPLTATGTLKWYTALTGGTALANPVIPSTALAGPPVNYYVTQTDVNSCESVRSNVGKVTVTTGSRPTPPVVSAMPVVYCQYVTPVPLSATAITGNTLTWYGPNETGGTASVVATTPPTDPPVSTRYYVSQTDGNGCESSNRAFITVTVNALPATPTTIPIPVCQKAPVPLLTSAVTATGSLTWYTSPVLSSSVAVAPTLSSSAVGQTTYYVTQTDGNGCVSAQGSILFTVNALPLAPTVASHSVLYCQGSIAPPLTATAPGILKWYTTRTGTVPLTNLVPPTAIAGPVTYYVSQTNGNGCEGPRDSLTVVTSSKPALPLVTVPPSYCQNAVPVSLSATATPTNTLKWYADATTTTVIPTPTPVTNTPGITLYYVSQTDGNGCESDRAVITVTVNPLPTNPITIPITLCQNATPVSLISAVTATGTLKWYTASSGGVGSTTTPTFSTSSVGSTTYYVSQTDGNACESGRSSILLTIKPLPTAPVVTPNPVVLCQSSVAVPLSAMTTDTLRWYDPAGNVFASITPSTATVGPTVYRVSRVVNGCEGPVTSMTVVVINKPNVPAVVVPSPYCQTDTPASLSATGLSLKWYSASTGSTSSTVSPTPSTTTAGITLYYVTQTDLNGCESDRASIAVQVKSKPNPPVVTASFSVCADKVTSLTATFDNGGTLNWYATQTGGTPTSTAPIPATNVIGAPISYYVSQTVNGCESNRATIDVTIKALPVAPAVSAAPVEYCEGTTAIPLSATATGSLNWYTAQTGGTASANALIPQTLVSNPPTSYYYVSQTVNGCEGPRASIAVTINPKPARPTVVASFTYCQNTTAASLTATAPGMLKWYADATGSTVILTPTPLTTMPGATLYYVSQTDGKGCESDRATITVMITATPVAPTTAPISVCQNSTPILLTATASGTLNWYTARTGVGSTSVAPMPPTSASGTFTYYVSQSVSGCEGPKDSIIVTIKPLPIAPPVNATSFSLCQNSTPTALTATASLGGTLNWYTVPGGGVSTVIAPIPSTSTAGPVTYYVSQSVNGCEGPRMGITVTIIAIPGVPAVSTNTISLCQGSAPIALTATASAGGTLNWYTVATGGTATPIAPTLSTSVAGTTTYYVSQSANGCEGLRMPITTIVIPTPVLPVTSANPINLCQNSTPISLTASVSPGGTPNWYTVSTGGTSTSVAPIVATTTVGPVTYYVSQSVSGCEGPLMTVMINILPLPAAPMVNTNTISICQNSVPTALTATASAGGTLNWYTVPTGGTPTFIAPIPPTSTAGAITYYVSQSVNGCEGPRTTITVTIKPLPAAPTVSAAPLTYCQGVTAVALIATQTNGGILNWYGTNAGGAPSPIAPIPATTTPGVSTYYVSQSVNGCEGPQALIVVLIQATPLAPTVGATPIYCQGGTSTALSAIASVGGSLNWYTTQTGGTASSTPPTPPVTNSGSVTYYVSQSVSNCEGPRVSLTATIRAAPGAPAVIPSLAYCLGSPAIPLAATQAGGGTLNWYTNAIGGSASSVAPTPPTNTAGTILYYVSQTDAMGCESNRTSISVKVNPLPVAPATTPASFCQGSIATALVATPAGGTLNWYTAQIGGTASLVAPIPVTTTAGLLTYYVSQTDINGCESNRSLLLVTITPLPAAPAVTAIAPVCQNTTPIVLSAAGQGLKWYADATSTASLGSSVTQPTTQAGTFTYYVSQTVNLCESPRALAQVVVNALPIAPTVVAIQNGCQDVLAVPLTAVGTALQWYDASDNLISPPTPVTKVDVTQTYTYKVTQTTLSGCISPKATLTYIVNVTPPPAVVPLVSYCQNATALPLQATGTTLKWTSPAGVVTTVAPTPITTIVTAGASYSVSQTSALGCESRKSEIKVVVNAVAVARIEGTTTVNLGSSAVLSLTLTGAGPYSYTLSDGTTGTAESTISLEPMVKKIAVTPAVSTTYTVTAISNACGAGTVTGAAIVSVTIPTIATSALSASMICTGASITVPFVTTGVFTLGNAFTVEIASAAVDSASRKYIPISNGVIQGPSIVTTIPNTIASGQYYVRVTASNTSFPISGTRSSTLLTVKAAPTAAFIADKKLIYKGESAELFFTLSGDAPWTITYMAGSEIKSVASATNLYSTTITPATTTTYKLTSVANICGVGKIEGVDTTTIRVNILLAEEDPFIKTVKVYPVPTDGAVTVDIDVPLQKEPAQLQLMSLDGHIWQQLTTRQRQNTLYLDRESAGTYLLYIKIGNQWTIRKILKR